MKSISCLFALLAMAALPLSAQAGTVLFHCEKPLCQSAILDPKIAKTQSDSSIRVTGTYTNSDHSNIVGLAVIDGRVLNANRQKWDGVFMISQGEGRIMHRQSVEIDKLRFNLDKEKSAFLDYAQSQKLSVIQAHLLIHNSKIDVRNQARQPRYVRRMLYQMENGDLGIYQTENAETLYDAAREIAQDVAPFMAINLDMGSFDFCVLKENWQITRCGMASVSANAFSNFIELSK